MQAYIFSAPGDPSVITLAERPLPDVSENDLLVEVNAFGLNRADLVQREGRYSPPPGVTDIPGLEIAGIVTKTGSSISDFKVGDRVMGLVPGGAYGEFCLLDAGLAWRVPEEISFETAAALPEMVMTSWLNLIEIGQLKSGMKVLIHAGASGIGSAAIQLAKQVGALVAVTAGSDEKLDFCQKLGADLGINYKLDSDFHLKIKEHWGDVDLILDPVGAGYLERNISCLKTDGHLILIGLMQGAEAKINLGAVLMKRLSITGSTLRSLDPGRKRLIASAIRQNLLPSVWSGAFQVKVDRVFPVTSLVNAHEYMQENRNLGKIVVVWGRVE